jgi:arylsulfatase A-like enzyme
MTARTSELLSFILVPLLVGPLACSGQEDVTAIADDRPERIVLIVVDMLRRDHVGAYRAERPTPHIDALAAAGQVFQQASASFGSTSMSMGALFTGRTPSIESDDPERSLHWSSQTWCGLARFAAEGETRCVPVAIETLAEAMEELGYEALGVTSNALLYEPAGFARGFRRWEETGASEDVQRRRARGRARLESGRFGGTLWPSVNRAVEAVLDARESDRFFLYVHYMDAHDYMPARISYAEAVGRTDAGIGDLLERLDQRGLRDHTTFIVTSDHGERFDEPHPVRGRPKHLGNPSFESLLRVPLIVSPALFDESSRLVRGQDLMPMLVERLGGQTPPAGPLEPGEVFLGEWTWQIHRRGSWKVMLSRKGDGAHLFDLRSDPGETRDVAAVNPDKVEAARDRVRVISRALSFAFRGPEPELSAADRERLEALGYVEAIEHTDAE